MGMMNDSLQRRIHKSLKADVDGNIYAGNIEVFHNKIHNEEGFNVSHLFTAVANDGVVNFHITGVTNSAHLTLIIKSEGKCIVRSYSGTTYTNVGTGMVKFNRYIGSTNTGTTLSYHTATVNVLGTLRQIEMIGEGNNPAQAIGGSATDFAETVLPDGKDLYVTITNTSGAASDINVIAVYYED